jgi:DNA modification methylase
MLEWGDLMGQLAPDVVDAQVARLLVQYGRTGAPIPVVFRDLVQVSTRRATHGFHPYPARLLASIPRFFLAATQLSARGDLVLDPFCGSGTVPLEAILSGRDAYGADSNPLALLLTRAKTTAVRTENIRRWLRDLVRTWDTVVTCDYPDVVNMDYWFYPHVKRDLLKLLVRIRRVKDAASREVLLATFSACLPNLSLADPRLSVPVRLKDDQYPRGHWLEEKTRARLRSLKAISVLGVFQTKLNQNLQLLDVFSRHEARGTLLGLSNDARQLTPLKGESVGLTITSPPYLGAQKYIRSSSLSLTWLGYCAAEGLRTLEDKSIGREHHRKSSYQNLQLTSLVAADQLLMRVHRRNPLRAHIAVSYLQEMSTSFQELARVTRFMGTAIFVVGTSMICGEVFQTPDYLTDIAARHGFDLRLHLVDTIRSRSLLTKRASTAGRIDSESILLFRKVVRS